MLNTEQSLDIADQEPDRSIFLVTFDVLFIMLLCFATLLSTMLMRGTVIVGADAAAGLEYSFDIASFFITAAALGFYLLYIVNKSEKELREMVKKVYDEANENLA